MAVPDDRRRLDDERVSGEELTDEYDQFLAAVRAGARAEGYIMVTELADHSRPHHAVSPCMNLTERDGEIGRSARGSSSWYT